MQSSACIDVYAKYAAAPVIMDRGSVHFFTNSLIIFFLFYIEMHQALSLQPGNRVVVDSYQAVIVIVSGLSCKISYF